ncbi:MAG TPA: hypothetical protein VII39_02745, partial [Bradyrhizobium sp.]
MVLIELSFEVASNDFRRARSIGLIGAAENGLEEVDQRIRVVVELVVERAIGREIAGAIDAVEQQPPGDGAVLDLFSQRMDQLGTDAGACAVEHLPDQPLCPLATDALQQEPEPLGALGDAGIIVRTCNVH